jgi:alanine-glyoxylate transaminase/serine-glyoxylate transaminase/serine-pyruvate transaminase
MEAESAKRLLDFCRHVCGVVLGVNIGGLDGQGFRIGHMGDVSAPTILGTLAVVETALQALAIPHGKGGVDAAMAYLAEAIAIQPAAIRQEAAPARKCAVAAE